MFNRVMLCGRVASDITKDSNIILISVPRSTEKEKCDIIECVINDKMTEAVNQYCHKGDMIAIAGSIQTEGIGTDYKEKVVCEKISFLAVKKDNEGGDKDETNING